MLVDVTTHLIREVIKVIFNLGDSYSLKCEVVDNKPSISIVGDCFTVNYSNSCNDVFSYINHGTFRGFFINKHNRIVFKSYVEEYVSDNEVLVVIPSNKGLVYFLFDINTGECVYSIKE